MAAFGEHNTNQLLELFAGLVNGLDVYAACPYLAPMHDSIPDRTSPSGNFPCSSRHLVSCCFMSSDVVRRCSRQCALRLTRKLSLFHDILGCTVSFDVVEYSVALAGFIRRQLHVRMWVCYLCMSQCAARYTTRSTRPRRGPSSAS
jgi:hypothetical protein